MGIISISKIFTMHILTICAFPKQNTWKVTNLTLSLFWQDLQSWPSLLSSRVLLPESSAFSPKYFNAQQTTLMRLISYLLDWCHHDNETTLTSASQFLGGRCRRRYGSACSHFWPYNINKAKSRKVFETSRTDLKLQKYYLREIGRTKSVYARPIIVSLH